MNLSSRSPLSFLARLPRNPGLVFALIIVTALLAFEMFNYSTTDYALQDLLGPLSFLGLPWATILALAFCGIDFAGIARLFMPSSAPTEPKEVWYLFGAWLLAATMNALLTWWGVSMAIASHTVRSTAVLDPATLTHVVPVFVALMVWLIRILIIGTLSVAGDRLLGGAQRPRPAAPLQRPVPSAPARPVQHPVTAAPAPRPANSYQAASTRPEPSYHSLSMAAPRPAPKPASGNDAASRML